METFAEEEYKKRSGSDLDGEQSYQVDSSELESDAELDSGNERMDIDGSSIEFQNETSSEDSFGSELIDESSDLDSDVYHSANEDASLDESAVAPRTRKKGSLKEKGASKAPLKGNEEDVFMDNFSDSSADSNNLLGKLETEVMNLSLSKFRR